MPFRSMQVQGSGWCLVIESVVDETSDRILISAVTAHKENENKSMGMSSPG